MTTIEPHRAAELLGIDTFTLGSFELNEDDVDEIQNLVRAAAACERAHAAAFRTGEQPDG